MHGSENNMGSARIAADGYSAAGAVCHESGAVNHAETAARCLTAAEGYEAQLASSSGLIQSHEELALEHRRAAAEHRYWIGQHLAEAENNRKAIEEVKVASIGHLAEARSRLKQAAEGHAHGERLLASAIDHESVAADHDRLADEHWSHYANHRSQVVNLVAEIERNQGASFDTLEPIRLQALSHQNQADEHKKHEKNHRAAARENLVVATERRAEAALVPQTIEEHQLRAAENTRIAEEYTGRIELYREQGELQKGYAEVHRKEAETRDGYAAHHDTECAIAKAKHLEWLALAEQSRRDAEAHRLQMLESRRVA